MKQEILEEAGIIAAGMCENLDAKEQAFFIAGFIECAKWQEEQDKNKYSEEEVHKIISSYQAHLTAFNTNFTYNKWFEKFKKK